MSNKKPVLVQKNPYEPNCLENSNLDKSGKFTLHKSNRLRMNDRIYKICPCHSVHVHSPKFIETLPDNFSTLGNTDGKTMVMEGKECG